MERSWGQRLARRLIARAAKYAGIPLRDPALVAMFGHDPAASGVDVDEATALNFSAVWAAVNLLSSSVASLPAGVFKRQGDGGEPVEDHPVHALLSEEPNPDMTPYTFHETLQAHVLTWGNAYVEIERAGDGGPPVALWPLLPNQVRPECDDAGNLVYQFTGHEPGEEDKTFQPRDIIHVPGLGFDGVMGYPVIQQARESIGLGLASEKFGAGFFGNGSLPHGVISHPTELSPEAKKNLRESWERMHRGPENTHRVAILDEAMKYEKIGIPPEDAQFLETRQFQVVEIARWFNVPPHMLRDLSNATFTNIEHQGIEFLTYSLRPWLIRWRQEYRRKLFSPEERKALYVDHDVQALLQTDMNARYDAYTKGRNGGWLTLNDILKRENKPALPPQLGDSRLVPSTMRVVDAKGNDVFGVGVPGEHGDKPSAGVEETAMNGAQVASLLQVITAVAANQIHPDTAKHMILVAFPAVPEQQIEAMVKPYRKGV